MQRISPKGLGTQVLDSECFTICAGCAREQHLAECSWTSKEGAGLYRCSNEECRLLLVVIRPARAYTDTTAGGNPIGSWFMYTRAELVIHVTDPSLDAREIHVAGHGVPDL